MSDDDIDLTAGEDEPSSRPRRRRRSSAAADAAPSNGGISDNEMRAQLHTVFDGWRRQRDTRGDEELADAISEEMGAMAEGVVTLTTNIKPLRVPILLITNVAVVALAFVRVGGIVWGRWRDRREARQAEIAAQQAWQDGQPPEHEAPR